MNWILFTVIDSEEATSFKLENSIKDQILLVWNMGGKALVNITLQNTQQSVSHSTVN